VGIKSREIYEAPAAVTLLAAHEGLEALTLSKDQLRLKARIAQEYAELIYNGLWFTAHHQDLAAYVQSTQRHVTGAVRVRLHKGSATVVGRKSPRSLYDFSLATYDKADAFDRTAAVGFIHIWGLPVRVQAQAQMMTEEPERSS
ncbi:MAG: argininosuccinate synthase, partial [Chloroflexi bacterium]|nr:argininosuccinate synthase [Chloroflexota bacterium]